MRRTGGGCETWNRDADWSNDVAAANIDKAVRNAAAAVGPQIRVLDISTAFNGRRLCEKGVGTLEERGLLSWTAPGASDKTEWVERIRVETGVTGTPYFIQESLHPNCWGQLALRNCVRQVYNAGNPRGGSCTRPDGVSSLGEPNMAFSAAAGPPPPTEPVAPPAPAGPGAPAGPAPAPTLPEGTLPETA